MLKSGVAKGVPGAPERGRPRDEETTICDDDDVPIERRRHPPPRGEEMVAQYGPIVAATHVREESRLAHGCSDTPVWHEHEVHGWAASSAEAWMGSLASAARPGDFMCHGPTPPPSPCARRHSPGHDPKPEKT